MAFGIALSFGADAGRRRSRRALSSGVDAGRRWSRRWDVAEDNLPGVLSRLGVAQLPPAPYVGGMYVPLVSIEAGAAGGRALLYVSGHPPLESDGEKILGVCYHTADPAAHAAMVRVAQRAAAHNALAILATVRAELGTLNRVRRLVKSLAMVNVCASPEQNAWRGDGPPPASFASHPDVMNGYSLVMADVFGHDAGIGARSAVGMSLPNGIATEVEAIFELEDEEAFGLL